MASIKCSNCPAGHHTSVNEVRACYSMAPDPRHADEARARTASLADLRRTFDFAPENRRGPGNGLALVKAQRTALRTALADLAPGKPHVNVAATVEGRLRFFKLDLPQTGKWADTIFVKEQASDDLYPVKSVDRQARILDAVLANVATALARYGQELGSCGICGKTLTDEDSRARGIGPVCLRNMGAMI
jgi:uncharacterized protein DUF6011